MTLTINLLNWKTEINITSFSFVSTFNYQFVNIFKTKKKQQLLMQKQMLLA